jgi:hypothetical protein
MDQRRADALVDICAEKLTDPKLPKRQGQRPTVQVTGGILTLLGLRDDPGELTGYGPITAEHLREIAADGDWHRFITAPDTGALISIGTKTYRPKQALRDFMVAAEPTCDFPGAGSSACAGWGLVRFARRPTPTPALDPLSRPPYTNDTVAKPTPTGPCNDYQTATSNGPHPPEADASSPPTASPATNPTTTTRPANSPANRCQRGRCRKVGQASDATRESSRALSRDRTRCPRCPASRCTTRRRHRQALVARVPHRAGPVVRIRPQVRPGAFHPRARCRPARQDAADS